MAVTLGDSLCIASFGWHSNEGDFTAMSVASIGYIYDDPIGALPEALTLKSVITSSLSRKSVITSALSKSSIITSELSLKSKIT